MSGLSLEPRYQGRIAQFREKENPALETSTGYINTFVIPREVAEVRAMVLYLSNSCDFAQDDTKV
jgi:hypothetical protein